MYLLKLKHLGKFFFLYECYNKLNQMAHRRRTGRKTCRKAHRGGRRTRRTCRKH